MKRRDVLKGTMALMLAGFAAPGFSQWTQSKPDVTVYASPT